MKDKKVNQLTLDLLNKKNSEGESAIYEAIISGQVKKVESLLHYGVDTHRICKSNYSALDVAFNMINNNKNKLDDNFRQNMLLIIGHLLKTNTVVDDWTIYKAIQALNNTKEVDLLFTLIKKCQSFDTLIFSYSSTEGERKAQPFLHWLVNYDCDHSVFEAVLERVEELNQLKSMKAEVGKLPNFFSQAQKTAAFRNEVPDEFICPITKEKMQKPVTLEDGYSYDEEAIKEHLAIKKTSPMTNLVLINPTYHENRFLKNIIEAHKPINKPQLNRSQSMPDLKISL